MVSLVLNNGKLGYFYLYNYLYPSLKLKNMPVGNPTISSSKELISYFGFCYAKIKPPTGLDKYLTIVI